MDIYVLKIDTNPEFIQSDRELPNSVKLPIQFDLSDTPYIKISTNEEDPSNYVFTVDNEAKIDDQENRKKERLGSELHNQLVLDVYTEMYNVFKTRDANSAAAYLETWKDMKETPLRYVGVGLYSDEVSDNLLLGQTLDTIEEILEYSNIKLEKAFVYGIWRMKRIQEFTSVS